MKRKTLNPKIKTAILFFVLLLLVAIPLTFVIRARIEMGR